MPEIEFNDFMPVLPEEPEDSRFLLAVPEDFDYLAACKSVEGEINDYRRTTNSHLISAVKAALKLPAKTANEARTVDKATTTVILNVIEASKRLCGYPDSGLIFSLLRQRRNALKAQIEDSPTDPGIK